MQEVFDFLKKCGIYYLATAEGDGNIEVYYIENAMVDICSFAYAPKHYEV